MSVLLRSVMRSAESLSREEDSMVASVTARFRTETKDPAEFQRGEGGKVVVMGVGSGLLVCMRNIRNVV